MKNFLLILAILAFCPSPSSSLPMEGSSMLITSEYVQSGGRGLKIMFRCLAIDDEPLALKQLVAYISKVQFLELAAQCQSALEAREFLENDTVDAIFCDINMPDLNGMDFVKSLAVPPLVVFTTAYSEYAVEGFRVNAVDYLLKPFGFQEFQRAAQRLLERKMGVSPLPFPKEEADTLFLKTDNRIVNVNISDIRYIEAMSEYLKVWLDSQPKPVITLLSMKKIDERLPNNFMRIHRSYIINLTKIQEVNKNRVVMDADTYLPIGDLYKDTFQKYISTKFLSR
jgi:DNA-binding LytR/AlgR family response regulator